MPVFGSKEFLKCLTGLAISYTVKCVLKNDNWLRFRSRWEKLKYSKFNPAKNHFESVLIQTITGCNLSCPFCPANKPGNSNYGGASPGTKMPMRIYKKIIDDLAVLDYSGIVRPCLMNEPLLDNRLTGLIRYADSKLPNARIQIESNGELITEKILRELFQAGFDEAIFNYYPTSRNLKKVFNEMDINIDTYFLQPLYVLWKPQKRKTRCIFVVSRGYDEDLSNRAGNVPRYKTPLKRPLRLMCDQPFRYTYIGYNGKVVLCCNDWGFEKTLGDVKKASLWDIWIGKVFQEVRRCLLRGERKGPCLRCDNTPRGPGKGIPGGLSSLALSLRNMSRK